MYFVSTISTTSNPPSSSLQKTEEGDIAMHSRKIGISPTFHIFPFYCVSQATVLYETLPQDIFSSILHMPYSSVIWACYKATFTLSNQTT